MRGEGEHLLDLKGKATVLTVNDSDSGRLQRERVPVPPLEAVPRSDEYPNIQRCTGDVERSPTAADRPDDSARMEECAGEDRTGGAVLASRRGAAAGLSVVASLQLHLFTRCVHRMCCSVPCCPTYFPR